MKPRLARTWFVGTTIAGTMAGLGLPRDRAPARRPHTTDASCLSVSWWASRVTR